MFKKNAGKMRLKVEAATPYDEIFLIDGGYHRVAGGVGNLDVKDLDPGLYKLKFKTGNNIEERSVLLNQPLLEIKGPQIELSSPMPLRPVTAPSGAFIEPKAPVAKRRVVRARAAKQKAPAPTTIGSEVLFYIGTGGREVFGDLLNSVDLFDDDDRSLKLRMHVDSRALAARVKCKPGFLRLRVDLGQLGKVEMPIWTTENFQTAVFLPLSEFGTTDIRIRPDILKAGICMRSASLSGPPNWEAMRETEQARISLQEGRAALPQSQIQRMLVTKFQDPMGGILAAHLLLLEKQIDMRLFDTVTRNLTVIAPDHPDVRILRAWKDKLSGTEGKTWELRHPPMLSPSWRLLNDSWMKSRVRIPDDSIANQIASCLWGQSVWLLWRAMDRPKLVRSRKTN